MNRLRKWWWVRVRGLLPDAAADLMEGADAGEDVGCRLRRTGPRSISLERIDALDRNLRSGGKVADAVVRGIRRDIIKGDDT